MSHFVAQSPDSKHAVQFEANDTNHALVILQENGYADYKIVWSTVGTLRLKKITAETLTKL
jgi:hypothetical protein